jgi:hypothetical protein
MVQLSPSGADVVLCIAAAGLPAALALYVCLQVLKLLASGDVVHDPHTTIAPRFPSAFNAQGGVAPRAGTAGIGVLLLRDGQLGGA